MNAQEWFTKNLGIGDLDDITVNIMERYANYKTRELEEKILAFKNELYNLDATASGTVFISPSSGDRHIDVVGYYMEFFNITTERNEQNQI